MRGGRRERGTGREREGEGERDREREGGRECGETGTERVRERGERWGRGRE